MPASVRRTLTAIPEGPSALRDWTRYLNGLFFNRSFTTTLEGCTTEPQGTARYTVSAGIVCLALPGLSGESNSALAFLSSLPEEITPNHDQTCIARIIDNGVTDIGIIQVGIDTGITLYKDIDGFDGASFTASGTKGLKSSIIVYSLDI